MKWLKFIFDLTPVCMIIDFLEEWLGEKVNTSSSTLDDYALVIIMGMLRSAFNCHKTISDES